MATTESDIEQLRRELHVLKQATSVDKTLRARKLRAQIALLEAGATGLRFELTKLEGERPDEECLVAAQRSLQAATSNLVNALFTANGSLVDDTVVEAMDVLRRLRSKLQELNS